jgi:hypothetical protein
MAGVFLLPAVGLEVAPMLRTFAVAVLLLVGCRIDPAKTPRAEFKPEPKPKRSPPVYQATFGRLAKDWEANPRSIKKLERQWIEVSGGVWRVVKEPACVIFMVPTDPPVGFESYPCLFDDANELVNLRGWNAGDNRGSSTITVIGYLEISPPTGFVLRHCYLKEKRP